MAELSVSAEVEMSENTDGVTWDWVFVFENVKKPNSDGTKSDDDKKVQKWLQTQKLRKELIDHLRSPAVGLLAKRKRSSDGTVIFLLISATQERLESQAQQLEYKMKLKDDYGGGFTEFLIEDKDKFLHEDPDEGLFRRVQRIHLIETILQGDAEFGGAGLSFTGLLKDGVVNKMYCMHNEPKRKELIHQWASAKKSFSPQPLHLIRNYFGEEITLYFAWLGFYTQWLIYATIGGIIVTPFWIIDRQGYLQYRDWAAWGTTVYAVFLSLWATLFLEYWKRYNNSLNYSWGTSDYQEREVERPTFIGVPTQGVYYKGTWVPLEEDEKKYPFKLPAKKKYYSSKYRNAKVTFGMPLIATMVVVVGIVTFAVLSLRLTIQRIGTRVAENGGSVAGGSVNAISIIIMNILWKKVATILTNWENYRTESEYTNSLIFKIFVFYFANSYTSLYYIAFFKGKGILWGTVIDKCSAGNIDPDRVSYGCADEITIQLVTILGVNMFIGQTREVLLPWALGKIRLYMLLKKTEEERHNIPLWERDYKKNLFEGTFDEYSEMIIQYGYMTIFAATFPLAPLMCLLNNIIEIRTDAFKLVTSNPRPPYKGAQNIGTWYAILEVIGLIAVFTNCALLGLSFGVIYRITAQSAYKSLLTAVILEHVIIVIKFIISYLVPDLPGWIIKRQAYQEFIKEETFKAEKLKNYTKPVWSSGEHPANKDSDDERETKTGDPTLELRVE